MPAPATLDDFLALIQRSGLIADDRLDEYLRQLDAAKALPAESKLLADHCVRDGLLTYFQAEQLLKGKHRGFTIGKYKVLERIGIGGMGQVYLCEHERMRRRVAIKVLPTTALGDPGAVERFEREARAAAALDHPNIVRAFDLDQQDKLHFLVMEYIDGPTLYDLVRKHGPMEFSLACHSIRQAALGLQHAHDAGLVHRDIKPSNILVDKQGVAKLLDLGLARFRFDHSDMLTLRYDANHVLGTADYVAPEQTRDSHDVDGRADIYGLGATFYFVLAGRPPFVDGTVAEKLVWHQKRMPPALAKLRKDIPPGLVTIVERMMAKLPDRRYATPLEVAQALEPWTQSPNAALPVADLPALSPAALGAGAPPARGMGHRASAPPVTPGGRAETAVATPAETRANPFATAVPTQFKLYTQLPPRVRRAPGRAWLLGLVTGCVVLGGIAGWWLTRPRSVFVAPADPPKSAGKF